MDRDDLKDLVSRIDERTTAMKNAVDSIRADIQSLENRFVTKDQFEPVKTIVYGLVGVVLMAVATAIVALVIIK